MPYNFDLPPEANEITIDSDRITLPFAAPFLWWMNGDNHYKPTKERPQADARYFGGWSSNQDGFDIALADIGRDTAPAGFSLVELVGDEGDYSAYITRAVSVVPIGKRSRWIKNDEGKSRSHVQYLCYMAGIETEENRKLYVPFAPVVLSAKGWSAAALETAFQTWGSKTAKARNEFASKAPAWFFYAPIGTFGKEPNVKQVGGKQKSPITPCSVYVPDDVTADVLQTVFVGDVIAGAMVEYRRLASDWLTAWQQPAAGEDAPESAQPAGRNRQSAPPPPTNFTEDNLPF